MSQKGMNRTPNLYLNALWEKKRSGSRYPPENKKKKKSNSPSGLHRTEKQSKDFSLKGQS